MKTVRTPAPSSSTTALVRAAESAKRIPVAVPSSAARRGATPLPPGEDERHADRQAGPDRDQPVAERRVGGAAGGVGEGEEDDQRRHHQERRPDVDPPHPLAGEADPERQREDDARDEQRLDDGEPAEAERRRLAEEAERVGGDPREPDRPAGHPQEQPGAGAAGGRFEPGALLQDGAEREEERRGEGEDDGHRRESRRGRLRIGGGLGRSAGHARGAGNRLRAP